MDITYRLNMMRTLMTALGGPQGDARVGTNVLTKVPPGMVGAFSFSVQNGQSQECENVGTQNVENLKRSTYDSESITIGRKSHCASPYQQLARRVLALIEN